jgi:hypothetical protein
MQTNTSRDDQQSFDQNNSFKKYKIEKIYISELGYLMVRLYDKEKKVWTTINFGDWKNCLNLNTDKIKIEDIEY